MLVGKKEKRTEKAKSQQREFEAAWAALESNRIERKRKSEKETRDSENLRAGRNSGRIEKLGFIPTPDEIGQCPGH